jgi:asparagine synthase (glutamine-hydrolysing)
MSVQAGKWNFDGLPVDREFSSKVETLISPYGPDSQTKYEGKNVHIAYGAFHTTQDSRRERQPLLLSSGSILTWDGRLDNREELICLLDQRLTACSADAEIVGAAITRFGLECLPKLIGDWALSLWNPSRQTLILAKDFAGTRHLYYHIDQNSVSWCTVLDPLIVLAKHPLHINEEYVAGWLGFYPASHLTPYKEISSVPPSSYVAVRPDNVATERYWDFDSTAIIRYRTDEEYEEHFRFALSQSVRRRLRADHTILAELSGGMDSSSIVCTADQLISSRPAAFPRVETISYFSNTEPNWNEEPYFREVERKRGQVGSHIDVSATGAHAPFLNPQGFPATPAALSHPSASAEQFAGCVAKHGTRVILSGIGGDEFTGGVPTPLPELMDLFAAAQFRTFFKQLITWALIQRRPWPHLFFETVKGFLPRSFIRTPEYRRPFPWLSSTFARCHRIALAGYPIRISLFGSRPTFQEHLDTVAGVTRQLGTSIISLKLPLEFRYPFLDRDLLTFLSALPRNQLVRPGQRRSLMRRALVGIVPRAIIERKRKAFVSRGPFSRIQSISADILGIQDDSLMETLRIVDTAKLVDELSEISAGQESNPIGILRTLRVENWLRELSKRGIIDIAPRPYFPSVASARSINPEPRNIAEDSAG